MFIKLQDYIEYKNESVSDSVIKEYKELGAKKLKSVLPKDIFEVAKKYFNANKKLFVVGGAVRDSLTGKSPKDFDLATDATIDESLSILKGLNVTEQGKAFGVVVLRTDENPEGYEIASFRKDLTAGRNPQVQLGVSIEEDVLRRDLTINALFYDIVKEEIIDLVGGIPDLINGISRTVGDAKLRFEEDPLRLIRAVRFASRYGKLDDNTFQNIKELAPTLSTVVRSRIVEEYYKGYEQGGIKFIELLYHTNLIKEIFPDIELNRIWNSNVSKDVSIYGATFFIFKKIDKNIEKELTKQLWPNKLIKSISILWSFKDFNFEDPYNYHLKYKNASIEEKDILEVYKLYNSPDDIKKMMVFLFKYKPSVDGNKLIELGFSGAALGKEKIRLERELFKDLLKQ